jgi:hypothetical protein
MIKMKVFFILMIYAGVTVGFCKSDIIVHLPFDSASDSVSPASFGTAATLRNGASITTGEQGISGEALALDGVNDFAQLIGYKGIGDNAPRTLSLWVKTAVNQADGTFLIGWGDTGYAQGIRFDLGLQGGRNDQLRNEYNAGSYALSSTGTVIANNQWRHTAVVWDGLKTAFYMDGTPYGTQTPALVNTQLTEDVCIGTGIRQAFGGYTDARWTQGLIDDVQIYSTALTAEDIQWLYHHPGQVVSRPKAINPTPADGSAAVSPLETMRWEVFNASDPAYVINIGTDTSASDVLNGCTTGSTASYSPPTGLLDYGTTYYWRVDVVDKGHVYSGQVWSFSTGGKATHPIPADGMIVPPEIQTISWTGDALIASYHVYFGVGNNLEWVGNYTAPVVGFSDLADALGMELLPGNTTYRWRVDTLDAGGAVLVTGPIWTLTLPESYYYSLIEDFDRYADTTAMRQIWTAAEAAEVTLDSLLHIMNLTYDCAEPPHTGQAAIMFDVPQTWIQDGWKAIQINFRGQEDNHPAGLFIVLDDGANEAVVFHPDSDAVTWPHWQQWDIPLSDFIAQGIDLNHIVALSIGVGNGAGAAGTLYLNDMRLYPLRCLPDRAVPGDINRDCRVDSADFLLLADYWLHSDYEVFAVEPLGGDLIAHYPFDENSGATAFDSSGNSHHATVVAVNPDTIRDEQGVEGPCVRLEDTDSFILLPASVFADIGPSVTLSLWIQGQAGNWPTEVDSVEFLAGPPPRQEHDWDQAEWMIDRAEVFEPNWNHYAFVKDGLAGEMRIFCNGLLVAQNDAAFMPINGSEAGQTRLSLTRRGVGPVKVDELRIYSKALTHADVLYLAAGPSGQASQSLVPVFTEADLTKDGHIGLPDLAHLARHWMMLVFWPR